MKKTKLTLRRESIAQLSSSKLGDVVGGIVTTSANSCGGTCSCPPQSSDCPPPTSVSTIVRLGQHYAC